MLSLSFGLCPSFCLAQDSGEIATRRLLMDQAEAARSAGDHRAALEHAEAAGRIQMSPSLRFFIARSQAQLERPADAMVSADLCLREAQRETTLASREQILAGCRAVLNEVRTRVAVLVVRPPSPLPTNFSLRINGAVLTNVLFGAPRAMNPGNAIVLATADGYQEFRRELTLSAGAREVLELTLTPASGNSDRPSSRATPQRIPVGAIALMGAGGALLLGGSILAGVSLTFASACAGTGGADLECPDVQAFQRAQTGEALHYAGLGIAGGGVLAVSGGFLWWLLARGQPATERISVMPSARGLHVGGVW